VWREWRLRGERLEDDPFFQQSLVVFLGWNKWTMWFDGCVTFGLKQRRKNGLFMVGFCDSGLWVVMVRVREGK
jgi:hypothetical protein